LNLSGLLFSFPSIRLFDVCISCSVFGFQGTRHGMINTFQKILPASSVDIPMNGDGEIRTHDPLLARQVLSQLSYTPMVGQSTCIRIEQLFCRHCLISVGLSGLEPPTSRLSGVRSNRLSYKPKDPAATCSPMQSPA
jgi:hypothetical protein